MSRFRKNAVKEAFDNLPNGVCFFDKNGMVTLCNYQMHRLIFALTGRDLQSLSELEEFLKEKLPESCGDGNIFLLEDGSAWRFSQKEVITQDGNIYTQIMASNVTELYQKQKELEQDNQRLEEYAERMHRLSANIITLIREEEILNMKMRVHDDIGRSVIATRQLLQQNRPMEEMNLTTWKNAVRLLKHDSKFAEDRNEITWLRAAADSIGIRILADGKLPEDTVASNLLLAAVRECMTNAVRHAGATELYVRLTSDNQMASAVITNNGTVPEGNITEGGGLSSLRVHIRKNGGKMQIKSTPRFELTVSVPVRLEETL